MAILASLDAVSSITTISRRPPVQPSPKLDALLSPDVSTWSNTHSTITPVPEIYFSALGTTKAAAGSVAAQRVINLDLNLSLARAAQNAGTKICVLISSAGSSASSMLPYPKMKGELEDAVKELGFETTVILRPGLLVGDRSERSFGQFAAGTVAGWMGSVRPGLKDMWAQDADVVAQAAVKSGILALQGKAPSSVWIIDQAETVRLGKMSRRIVVQTNVHVRVYKSSLTLQERLCP